MPRIRIEDLPVLEELSPREAKGIFGGYSFSSTLSYSSYSFTSSNDPVALPGDTYDGLSPPTSSDPLALPGDTYFKLS